MGQVLERRELQRRSSRNLDWGSFNLCPNTELYMYRAGLCETSQRSFQGLWSLMGILEITALEYVGALTYRMERPCLTLQAHSKYKRTLFTSWSLGLYAGSKWIDKSKRNKESKVDVSDNFNYCFLSLSESYIKTQSDSKSQMKGKPNFYKHV